MSPSPSPSPKRQGFRLKRDPLVQTNIKSFMDKTTKSKRRSSGGNVKSKWKELGLSDASDVELSPSASPSKDPTKTSSFNFYCDTLTPS